MVEVGTDYFTKFHNVISFSADAAADRIAAKLLDTKHERLRQRFDVFQGIVTGDNGAYILTQDQARAAKIESELLRPVLHGRDFERWLVRSDERLVLYVDANTVLKDYPHAEAWLQQFRSKLKKRRECVNGVIPWFSLQWPRNRTLLDLKEKIAVQATRNPRLKTRVVATLDESGMYGTQGVNFIVPKVPSTSLRFLVGILNSSAMNYLYATKFLNVAIKAEYLKDSSIPDATQEARRAIERLVDRILAVKAADPEDDVRTLEAAIDQLVYPLYGITSEEAAIIEGVAP